jgi:hypothetical protein
MTGFLLGAADCGHGESPRKTAMPEIVAVRLEHRSPPRPRSARQDGEQIIPLSGTNPHAAAADAIVFECCRLRKSGDCRVNVAEGGTAHDVGYGCFVRIEGFV